jgi:F-type H+-transporting ATPase subunit b
MNIARQFASTETAATGDIFSALGINWMMLIFQIVAFLILVWLLGKFVYPWLLKSVDERQDKIEAASKAASEAQIAAADAEAKVEKLLKKARFEAANIVATAKLESSAALAASEEKAKKRAEQIVIDAQSEIAKEVISAKNALHNETIELVALATEKIVGHVVSKSVDETLIRESLKAAGK